MRAWPWGECECEDVCKDQLCNENIEHSVAKNQPRALS